MVGGHGRRGAQAASEAATGRQGKEKDKTMIEQLVEQTAVSESTWRPGADSEIVTRVLNMRLALARGNRDVKEPSSRKAEEELQHLNELYEEYSRQRQ